MKNKTSESGGRGLFVAFEGIDGAGKNTQLQMTFNWLKGAGYAVSRSSEPNEEMSPVGKSIKGMLRGTGLSMPEDPAEFQRLYVIDRGQDIVSFIKPALGRGEIYLIERYGFSTIAYGMLSGKPAETFIKMHHDILGSWILWPDITFFLDISSGEAMKRIPKRNSRLEFFEKKEKLDAIRKNYLAIAKNPEFGGSVVVIDGERGEEEVFDDIKRRIEPLLGQVKQK